jgi:rod shape-determining protein MreB and related proteins
MSIFSRFAHDLAIDLGTANTCVFVRGRGIVVSEPSVVALNTASGEIEAVGTEAKEMLGRTPSSIRALKPLRDGVIADFDAAETMLSYFMRKARGRKGWLRPRVIVGVPAQTTAVERRAVRDSALRAKAAEVHLVEEGMAAAIGAGMPITEAAGNMLVDIGGGTTDVAVISLAGVVYSKSVRVAGNAMDDAIVQHAKKTHNLLIGDRTAEEVKIRIGSALIDVSEDESMEVKGRHLGEGRPRTVMMTQKEVAHALRDTVKSIVNAVRDALEQIPPELSSDILDRGIVLTGGGALLTGLDQRLRDETGLPVQIAEDALSTVVLGAGHMLGDIGLLRRVALS